MNLDQFFITFVIALFVGVILSNISKVIFVKLSRYYRKLTFRHVLLTPYTPPKKKKDEE